MQVGYDPVLSEQSARSFGIEPVSTDELFKRSDFITIHTPLTKETEYLLNTENLAKCKKGVRIVNCARGGIIDEAALLEAIKSGHVGGASLDVFEVDACLPPDCFLRWRSFSQPDSPTSLSLSDGTPQRVLPRTSHASECGGHPPLGRLDL